MAKDDFHVIVYRILAYLYHRLKNGEPAEPEMIRHDEVEAEYMTKSATTAS